MVAGCAAQIRRGAKIGATNKTLLSALTRSALSTAWASLVDAVWGTVWPLPYDGFAPQDRTYMVGAGLALAHRRQVSDPFVIATGYPTAPRPPRAGASHSPYSVRRKSYRVGAIPCGRPGGGGRPISTILILTPMGRGL